MYIYIHVHIYIYVYIYINISRLSTLSFNEKIFQEPSPPYQKVLRNSGYRHTLTYKRPENDDSSTNINKLNEIGKDK